ncbi:MAG: InlB B-repeat-containing protein [Atopobiaceae bacterium]|nr:InlB B-repeat-containing protein [Atopobiaceae bacterium]
MRRQDRGGARRTSALPVLLFLLALVIGLTSVVLVPVAAQESVDPSSSQTVLTSDAAITGEGAATTAVASSETLAAAVTEADGTATTDAAEQASTPLLQVQSDDELTPQADAVCKIGTTTYETLAAAFTAAADGDTIEMLVASYDLPSCITLASKAVKLTTDLTATGNVKCQINRTSAVGAGNPMMKVTTANTLTLDNLVVDGGGTAMGAQCYAFGMTAANSAITVTNCTFQNINNTKISGGDQRRGGVFYGQPGVNTLSLTGCSFDGCSAWFGGAVLSYGTVTATDCKFNGCVTTGSAAGALYVGNGGSLTVRSSEFYGCTAATGGAISCEQTTSVSVDGCTFGKEGSGCSAASDGGAIYIPSDSSSLEVTNSAFSYCTSSGGKGGAITSGAPINTIKGTAERSLTIENCSSSGNGGGVYLGTSAASATMADVTISSCTSGNSGGGLFVDGTTGGVDRLKMTDVTIKDNVATKYAGGAYTCGATLTNCTITGNEAKTARAGGLETYGRPTAINGCTISDNVCAAGGGGIDTNNTASLTITNTTISGNTATSSTADGGGILLMGNYGTPYLHLGDGVTITGNVCGRQALGGGIGMTKSGSHIYVSGKVVVKDNKTAAGLISNTEVYNRSNLLSTYSVEVEGALVDGSSIGIITRDGAKGELCVKGAAESTTTGSTAYTLTETSDIAYFSHDRVTRGEDNARLIVWNSTDSTYVLGGSQYQVQYWFKGTSDYAEDETLRTDDVDYAGTVIDQAGIERSFSGYKFNKLQYSTDSGVTWTDMPKGYALPDADGTLIRVLYDPITYKVTFVSEDAARGTVGGTTTQDVATGQEVASGTVTVTAETADDWFFTGWSYVTTYDDETTSSGYAYDYSTVPIEGATVFTARFAKQPFASIITSGGGSVSVTSGATAEDVPDGQLSDVYEWTAGTQTSFAAAGAFRAEPHYHISGISTVRPAASGDTNVTDVTVADGTVTTLNPDDSSGAQATLSLNADRTYGTLLVTKLPKAVSIRVTFEKDPSYKVSFRSYDGTDTTLYEEHDDLYDGDVIGSAPTGVPTRDGYTFMGWTTVAPAYQTSTTRPDYDAGARIAAADQTYYALWQENASYSYQVEIYLQDVDSTNAEDKTQYSLTSASSYPVNVSELPASVTELPTDPVTHPSYAGYEYKGFYADGVTAFSNDSGTITTADDNLVLCLYYTRTSGTLNMYDSDGSTKLFESKDLLYGEPLALSTPVKAGYTFVGWYYDTDFTKPVGATDTMRESSALVDGNLDVYARWAVDTRKGTLVITKATTGDYADKTREFHYAVTVTRDGIVENLTADLADGGTATFENVDLGTTYTVTETAVDGYTASPVTTLPDGGSANVSGDGLTVTGTMAYGTDTQAGKTTVAYTNTKVDVVPTGVDLGNSNLWSGVVVGASAFLLALLIGRRRARR